MTGMHINALLIYLHPITLMPNPMNPLSRN